MLKGHCITQLDAANLFGCWRLGARIYDLREAGFTIESETVKNGRKRYSKYYMTKKEIARAKEKLKEKLI